MDINAEKKKLKNKALFVLFVFFIGSIISFYVPYFFIILLLTLSYLIFKMIRKPAKFEYLIEKKSFLVTKNKQTLCFPLSEVSSIEHNCDDTDPLIRLSIEFKEPTPFGRSEYFLILRSDKKQLATLLNFISDFDQQNGEDNI